MTQQQPSLVNYKHISLSRARCIFLAFVFVSLVFAFILGSSRKVVTSATPESARPEPEGTDYVYESAISDVAFVGGTHVWATDRSGIALYHTHTGGSLEKTATNFEGKPLISFLDAKTGFVFAYTIGGQLWRTSDGGQTWQKVTEFDQNDFQFTAVHGFQFSDAQHGWLIDVFNVWRTQDGGAHWDKVFNLDAHPEAKELWQGAFSGPDKAVVGGPNGVYLTVDGGKSWKLTNAKGGVNAIDLLDDHTGWIWSDVLQRTDDGGKTWRELYKLKWLITIMSTQFMNKEEGWAAGLEVAENFNSVVRNPNSPLWHGVLLHTRNGGKNWEEAPAPTDRAFHHVVFSNSKNGWLLGMTRLYRTRDGGATWTIALDLSQGSQ